MKFSKHESDIRSSWRSINSLLGKVKSNECNSLKIQDNIISDPVDIANSFNNHFVTAATNLASAFISPTTPTSAIT